MVADEEAYDELTRTQPIKTKRESMFKDDDFRTWFGWLLVGSAILVVIVAAIFAISASDRANIKSRTDLSNQCIASGGSWTSHGDCIKK